MRILFYNWVPFDDDENRGGGVSIYQKNLISEMIKRNMGELYFISSGIAFDISRKEPHIVRTKNIFKKNCHTFMIVNSPILSPGHSAFDDMDIYLNDMSLYNIFRDFINKYGPFDVIHFNNFEGLSLNVLRIKEIFPQTKIIYSLHNYYAFCPQVNLWKHEEKNCENFQEGNDCLTCLIQKPQKEEVIYADKVAYALKRCHIYSHSIIFKLCFRYLGVLKKCNRCCEIIFRKKTRSSKQYNICAARYVSYRSNNIKYINQYVDRILCVSQRVRDIAVDMGVLPEKAIVDYIGTLAAENQRRDSIAPNDSEVFTIAYLGYMRKDKGFFFLMDALKKIPDKTAAKSIKVIIAAKITNPKIMKKLYKLGRIYHEIEVHDGYTHSELSNLLSDVNLGIIPVLWEDNLPQVAIELVAEGVPILTSDLGGAHEIANNGDFIFQNNNVEDFWAKLLAIYNDRKKLEDFWGRCKLLTGFGEHIKKLKGYYTE